MFFCEKIDSINADAIMETSERLASIAQKSLQSLYKNNSELLLSEINWKGRLDDEIKTFKYEYNFNILLQQKGQVSKQLDMTIDIVYADNQIGYYRYITDLHFNFIDEFFVLY